MSSQMRIAPEDRARLSKIESWRWCLDLALDWAVIIGTFFAFAWLGKKLWLAPFAAFVMGARINALGSLGHDAGHKVAFKNRTVNDLAAELFIGWPLMIRIADNYRPWHFEHHRSVATDKDPELPFRTGRMFQGPVPFRRVVFCFIADFFGFGILNLLAFFRSVFPKRIVNILPPLLMWSAFLGVTLALDALWVFLLWTYAVIFGFWAVGRVRTWSEHVALPDEHLPAFRFRPGLLARFFFFHHNGWCHYEHHTYPQIPYYNLPKMRALDKDAKVLSAFDLFWNLEKYTTSSGRPKSASVELHAAA